MVETVEMVEKERFSTLWTRANAAIYSICSLWQRRNAAIHSICRLWQRRNAVIDSISASANAEIFQFAALAAEPRTKAEPHLCKGNMAERFATKTSEHISRTIGF